MSTLIINRWPLKEVRYHDWLGDTKAVLLTTADSLRAVEKAALARFAEVVVMNDCPDFDIERLGLSLFQTHDFSSVVALAERDLIRAARLRGVFRVPGQDMRSALAYRDKFHMKEAWAAAGVPTPGYGRVDSVVDVFEFAERTGWPIVLKPRRGAASVGVEVINSASEFARLVERTGIFEGDSPAGLLAEEYVEHTMYQVNGAVEQGSTALEWPAFTSSGLAFKTSEAQFSYLLDPGDPLGARLGELNDRAIRSLPTPTDTLFHSELFLTGRGELLMNEIGSRIGGARVREEYLAAFGVDLVERIFRIQTGQEVHPLQRRSPLTQSGYAVLPPCSGLVERLPSGPAPFPGVDTEVLADVGSRLADANSTSAGLAAFVARGHDSQEVQGRLRAAIEWFQANSHIGSADSGRP